MGQEMSQLPTVFKGRIITLQGLTQRPFLKSSWVTEEIKAFIYIKLNSLGDGPQTPGIRITPNPCFMLRFLNLTLPLNFGTRSIGCRILDSAFWSTLGWFRLTLNFKKHWEMTFFSHHSFYTDGSGSFLISQPSLCNKEVTGQSCWRHMFTFNKSITSIKVEGSTPGWWII